MDIQSILDKTRPAWANELADFELTAQGDLRVFIDKEGGINGRRLAATVSKPSEPGSVYGWKTSTTNVWKSPALAFDRPLKKPPTSVRFAGQRTPKSKHACRD